MTVRFVKRDVAATTPVRGTPGSAGLDLSSVESGVVPPRGRAMVSTGLSVRVPEGTYGRIAPRSGLAAKHGIDVGAGVIDSDYTGVVKVVLFNHSDTEFAYNPGDRIAQFVLEVIVCPDVEMVDEILDEAKTRGEGGFGSTG
jgi:dUTP pyrophosphatase